MKYITLDSIVRSYLLKKRYPIHFYVEGLVQAAECLSELQWDCLAVIRTVKLTIGDYGAATLPCDYKDWCKIGMPNGAYTKPMVQSSGITRLNNFDSITGDKVLWPDAEVNAGYGFSNFVWFNDKLETTGRFYGGFTSKTDVFKVLPERNEIQVDNHFCGNDIILEYISDGSEADSATQIDPYAKMAIEAFIEWQHVETHRSYGQGDKIWARKKYDYEVGILRGRLNPLTISDIKNAVRMNTHGSIKG